MPNPSQGKHDRNSAQPNRTGLWFRIVECLGTSSLNAIAEKVGVKPPSVSEWKSGQSLPKIGILIEIANLGNTSLDWLLTGKEYIRQVPKPGQKIYGTWNHQYFLVSLNNDLF